MIKQTKVKTFSGYETLQELEFAINNFCDHKNVQHVQYSNDYGLYNAMVVYKVVAI